MDLYLTNRLQFHTDVNIVTRQDIQAFSGTKSTTLWNTWAGEKILKDKSLQIRLSVHNVLNQNSLNSQFANANYTIQNIYNVIDRYAMLSVLWNFTKTASNAR
jgi:hypothetical protein